MTDIAPNPEVDEVIEQEVPILIVPQYDVVAGEFNGFDIVTFLVEASDGVDTEVLTFALPSEDALRIARSLISVASTVRPMSVQQRIISLNEAGKENTPQ